MLDTATKKRIDDCRDILVGKLPDPKAQIEQITIGLIYKFMDDMDKEAIELGGKAKFFADYSIPDPENPKRKKTVPFSQYSWDNLFNTKVTAAEMLRLYSEAIAGMDKNPNIPQLFRDIFKNAFLPYRDPETLKLFLKTIGEFEYTHSEKLGDAFEYLLSVMGSQGEAGQFRTPRHIIDFLVAVVNPGKKDTILDPACGTAGFLISAFKHIKEQNKKGLTPDERKKLIQNFTGYDISPDMVRLSLVNLYLHGFNDPHIWEYDTLSSEERWDETADVILANPPFMSPKGGIRPHKKFSISSNRSEVLFVDYIAEHLNTKGRAGIIVPEGVIFQSGTAYKELRKMLVENYLYAVVSLPAGVFNPYSGVKTSILLMDAAFAKASNEILFVKIENDGYGLGAQRTPVKGSQLEEAIELIQQFKEGSFTESKLAHTVARNEIAKNGDYNLTGDRYKLGQDLSSVQYDIVEIGNVFKTSSGGTPLKDKEEYFKNGTIPWLRSGEVAQGYISSSELFITEEGLKNSSAKIFPVNTVLVAMYGATAGQVGILKFEASTNQAVCGILPNEKAIPEYLYLIVKSQKDYLISLSGGGAQPNISQKLIRELQIPLPPLSIQEEIVAEIEGWQKIIDGAKAVTENYKPKIDINPDWEMVELGGLAKNLDGKRVPITKSDREEGKYPYYGASGIVDYVANYIFDDDLLLISEDGANLLARVTPIAFSVSGKVWVNNHAHVLKFDKMETQKFVELYLNSISLEPYITGSAQPKLNQKALNSIPIPLPDFETQRQIVSQIEKEQALVNANKQLVEIFEQKIKDRIAKVWGANKEPAAYKENEQLTLAAEE
ncbi:MAG: N-6 DNA methylase [Chitinophagales bacterium]|nr:N-6 DNA methylase [Chitinophagales bacterium]